jgi:hypothetical protein
MAHTEVAVLELAEAAMAVTVEQEETEETEETTMPVQEAAEVTAEMGIV